MKKSMSFIAALAIATSLVSAMPSFADDKTVDIQYTVTDEYTITIPVETVTLNKDKTLIEVTADEVVVGSQKQLAVSVAGKGSAWEMIDTTDASNKLSYTVSKVTLVDGEITDSDSVNVGGGIITVGSGNTATATLNIVPGTPINAGTYSDTLTFTASVVDKE